MMMCTNLCSEPETCIITSCLGQGGGLDGVTHVQRTLWFGGWEIQAADAKGRTLPCHTGRLKCHCAVLTQRTLSSQPT